MEAERVATGIREGLWRVWEQGGDIMDNGNTLITKQLKTGIGLSASYGKSG